MARSEEPLLEIQGLTKRFPGVVALKNIDFSVKRNTVHVLVGENGAGKSTLVNIITGAYTPSEKGRFRFDGKDMEFHSPKDSLQNGIAAVQQHFSLLPDMSVAENIFLGREPKTRAGLVDYEAMSEETRRLVNELGVDLEPRARVRGLTSSDQQIVEICKAISRKPKLLLMDEPTSGLTGAEIEKLFAVIHRMVENGLTILYISHRLEEIFEIGEGVTVLRNGEKVKDTLLEETNLKELTTWITGQDLDDRYPKENAEIGEVLFEVRGLNNERSGVPLEDISLSVRRGEVVGLYGIMGAGIHSFAQTVFGVTPPSSGEIFVDGQACRIDSPQDAIGQGIGYLTEDRRRNGYVPLFSVRKNKTLVSLKEFCKFGLVDQKREAEVVDEYIEKLDVRTASRETFVKYLSGGNQQKVVFAKWLIANSRILLFSEPTRGIDIGAKGEMFRLMVEQAKEGAAILFISSELEEVIGMADRILVFREGRIVEEFTRGAVTKSELLACATKS